MYVHCTDELPKLDRPNMQNKLSSLIVISCSSHAIYATLCRCNDGTFVRIMCNSSSAHLYVSRAVMARLVMAHFILIAVLCWLLQILKLAKSFSEVWQDGKTDLAKPVLDENVVVKDLLFGNEIKGFDNWAKSVHSVFEVRSLAAKTCIG